MRGILYGIGVGPGEPELMTLKALNIIKKSDVIVLPAAPKEECHAYRIVHSIFMEIEKKEILCLPFEMTKDKKELEASHEHIYHIVSDILEQEKDVAFLTIGDPCIYSTYSYIHRKETESGGSPIIVNGVPSFCAAAAAMGITLADNREQLHIIPASYNIEETFGLKGTKVYMKSGKALKTLKTLLQQASFRDKFFVYSISNCGMADEKAAAGAENIDVNAGYLTIVIVKEKGD